MMIVLSHTPAKSHPWYLGIFWQMTDIPVNDALLLHLRNAEALKQEVQNLKGLMMDVVKALIYPEKDTRERPSKHQQARSSTAKGHTV